MVEDVADYLEKRLEIGGPYGETTAQRVRQLIDEYRRLRQENAELRARLAKESCPPMCANPAHYHWLV